MWYNGLLDLSVWQIVGMTLLFTHITIVSVTVYLHRYSAHRGLELGPILRHFFRLWLWLTTGMATKGWTALHRKHHAKCETAEDPHSPVVLGIGKVLREGAELYRAGLTDETLEKYGKGTPEDWLERKIYRPHGRTGIMIFLVIDLLLFGTAGITVWAVQMAWIPLFAAGVINGIGHYWGYRNYECADASTNIVPWGILIGGEELHNNHHTFPSSSKLSSKWYEFDIGWMYINIFKMLGLLTIKRVAPKAKTDTSKNIIDTDTLAAIFDNRFQIMATYAKKVVAPLVEKEAAQADADSKPLFNKAAKILSREESLVSEHDHKRIQEIIAQNSVLKTIYEKRKELQNVWQTQVSNNEELVKALKEWIAKAEATGIQSLKEFAQSLSHYTMQPKTA
ncbi:MAG: fatty acid desaturase [Gammaproteobacteria bacterium]|nr:fatty acid desaturase [Gammaproteobacteria bacterium]